MYLIFGGCSGCWIRRMLVNGLCMRTGVGRSAIGDVVLVCYWIIDEMICAREEKCEILQILIFHRVDL